MISCGEYSVLREYEQLKIPEDKFYRMQDKSKATYLKRFFHAEFVPKNGKKVASCNNMDLPVLSVKSLSVPLSQCGVTKLPFESIYTNSEKVLMKPNCVVKSPGDVENVFFVSNKNQK